MEKKMRVMTEKPQKGDHTILSRATDSKGNRQPQTAFWNVLGYGNNGVREHGVSVRIN